MNKTVVRCLLSRSHHPLIHFSTKSSLLHRVSTSSRYLTTRFMSTPPPDEMYEFDDPFSPSESCLTKEYSFLQDSLLDSAAHIDVHQVPITQSSDDARAIADAVSGGDDVFGSKSQKFLRQFREKLNESLVIEVLRLIERPSAVISFFVWAGMQIGYKHTAPVYNALVDLIVCDDDEKVPEELLQQIRDDDKEVFGEFLNVFVAGMGHLALHLRT